MVLKLEFVRLLGQFLVHLGSGLKMGIVCNILFAQRISFSGYSLFRISVPSTYIFTCVYIGRYIVSSSECQSTLYYEPHCVYNEGSLKEEQADIVITPVIKQLLPNFTLVSGQDDAVKLAKLLCAKYMCLLISFFIYNVRICSFVHSHATIYMIVGLLFQ